MKGEWILSDLMQARRIKQGAEWIGNWLALSPVTSITTHNHSCPVPLVALHMKSQIEASQSFSDGSREECGGVADLRVQGIWLAPSLSYRTFDPYQALRAERTNPQTTNGCSPLTSIDMLR